MNFLTLLKARSIDQEVSKLAASEASLLGMQMASPVVLTLLFPWVPVPQSLLIRTSPESCWIEAHPYDLI